MKTRQLMYLLMTLLISTSSIYAQTGSSYSVEQAQEMVRRHNYYRSEVGVPPIKWSSKVASYAQEWADHLAASGCDLEHRSNNEYGENLFWGYGMVYTPKYISDSWASEKKYWKSGKITMRNFGKTGHYTQMIWFESTEVGCGEATCSDGSVIVVCNYNPSGNMIGINPTGN